ncbi:MAG: TetR/AcrR family transcriptional regulator [Polyangiaceae bacterium]
MRKQPRQQRSRELVQSLIDATGRVIVARGIEATTTNHIAKEAGVDIASLYQYFANKEDLIEALVQNLTERAVLEATRRFAAFDVYAATPAELLRAVLQIGIRLARADPVVAAIAQDSRYLFDSAALGVLESRFQMLATLYFRHHFRSYPIDDLEVRLHIVSVSAFSTLARHFAQQPPLISDDVLVEELVQMLTPYLSAPRCP